MPFVGTGASSINFDNKHRSGTKCSNTTLVSGHMLDRNWVSQSVNIGIPESQIKSSATVDAVLYEEESPDVIETNKWL